MDLIVSRISMFAKQMADARRAKAAAHEAVLQALRAETGAWESFAASLASVTRSATEFGTAAHEALQPAPVQPAPVQPAPVPMSAVEFSTAARGILQQFGNNQGPLGPLMARWGVTSPANDLRPDQYEPFLADMRAAYGAQ